MTDYQPGALVKAYADGGTAEQTFFLADPTGPAKWVCAVPSGIEAPFWFTTAELSNIRPLVVLDLLPGGDFFTGGASDLRSLLRNLRIPPKYVRFTDLADFIEAQTKRYQP